MNTLAFLVATLAVWLSVSDCGAVQPFLAPAEPTGSLTVKLYPMENVATGISKLVTFGVPFPRGSLVATNLSTIRVLKSGAEIPAHVASLTPWRHLTNAALDGVFVRVARIQIHHTFSVTYPGFESITVIWGTSNRTLNVAGFENPRTGWHSVTSGTFVVADNVSEPDVYAVLPRTTLGKGLLKPGRMLPFDDSVSATRDVPTTMDATEHWPGYQELDHAQKNNFFSLINEDDSRVSAANQCPYKTTAGFDCWLYDRSSAMYVLYMRWGELKALREAVRSTDFYKGHVKTTGYFDLKTTYDDEKYSYNECMAYTHWLTGDTNVLTKIAQVVNAFQGTPTRWSPALAMWTERHAGFKLLANTVAYEVLGGASYKSAVMTIMDDFIWLQNGAAGQIPSARLDGGLYHYGSQHDWDWAEASLGASPWMTVLVVDAMLRCYAVSEDSTTAAFIRRIGTFEKGALRVTADHIYDTYDAPLTMTSYAVLYDGTEGQYDYGDVEHSLEVATTIAWARYFGELTGQPDASLTQKITDLYFTYDIGLNYWIRPSGPASGYTAYRLSPWRKYGWEHRPSGSLTWLMNAPTPYGEWAVQWGIVAAGTELDDADGDGCVNLLEYATGSNPTNRLSQARASAAIDEDTGRFAITFDRNINATDITIGVDETPALVPSSWSCILSNRFGLGWIGAADYRTSLPTDGIERVSVQATNTIAPTGFLRLRIQHEP